MTNIIVFISFASTKSQLGIYSLFFFSKNIMYANVSAKKRSTPEHHTFILRLFQWWVFASLYFTRDESGWSNCVMVTLGFLTVEEDRSASDSDDSIIPAPVAESFKEVGTWVRARNGLGQAAFSPRAHWASYTKIQRQQLFWKMFQILS